MSSITLHSGTEVSFRERYRRLSSTLGDLHPQYMPADADEATNSRVMWLLVIRQALFDYIKWQKSKVLRRRRTAEDAKKWLFDSSNLHNSLDKICEFVGVPTGLVRKTALRMTPKDVKKMEIQERENKFKPKQFIHLLASSEEDEDGHPC